MSLPAPFTWTVPEASFCLSWRWRVLLEGHRVVIFFGMSLKFRSVCCFLIIRHRLCTFLSSISQMGCCVLNALPWQACVSWLYVSSVIYTHNKPRGRPFPSPPSPSQFTQDDTDVERCWATSLRGVARGESWHLNPGDKPPGFMSPATTLVLPLKRTRLWGGFLLDDTIIITRIKSRDYMLSTGPSEVLYLHYFM